MAVMLVILDGMTDDPIINGKTPLECAGGLYWQQMCREGGHGTFRTAPHGRPVDSLGCIATLLGVEADRIPSGRACLEALAEGIRLAPEDAACRCNLMRLDSEGRVAGPYWDVPSSAAARLCARWSREPMELIPLGGCKNLLVIRGGAAEASHVQTHPPHNHRGDFARDLLPEGTRMAERLRALALGSEDTLDGTRCMLLPWDLSVPQPIPQWKELHDGSVVCVCATGIVRGLCRAMGIPVIVPAGATAEADTDLSAKAACALELAEQYACVIVHVNGADELSHRGDAAGKAAFLERVDRELLGPLLDGGADAILAGSDHSTLCRTGSHRGDAQPFALWRRGCAPVGDLGEQDGCLAVSLLMGGPGKER